MVCSVRVSLARSVVICFERDPAPTAPPASTLAQALPGLRPRPHCCSRVPVTITLPITSRQGRRHPQHGIDVLVHPGPAGRFVHQSHPEMRHHGRAVLPVQPSPHGLHVTRAGTAHLLLRRVAARSPTPEELGRDLPLRQHPENHCEKMEHHRPPAKNEGPARQHIRLVPSHPNGQQLGDRDSLHQRVVHPRHGPSLFRRTGGQLRFQVPGVRYHGLEPPRRVLRRVGLRR